MHQLLSSTDHTTVYVTSATEIIKAFFVLAGVLATAGLGIGIPARKKAKRARETYRRQQSEIHHSVVNTHDTILRDDVDKLLRLMRSIVRRLDRHSGDIGAMKRTVAEAQGAVEAAKTAAERAERAAATAAAAVAENEKRLSDHIDGR